MLARREDPQNRVFHRRIREVGLRRRATKRVEISAVIASAAKQSISP